MNMRILFLLFIFAATACNEAPRPFKHEAGSWKPPLAEPKAGYDILVEPVDGPSRPMAKLLARSVADSLVEREVSATVADSVKSRFVIKGKAEANWEDARAPFVMLILWTMFNEKGEIVGNFTQGVQGTWFEWENGDPRIIRSVGQEAAQPFAEMAQRKEKVLPPAELRGAGLMVESVIGAPGDGNKMLTDAIKEALRLTDVSITEDPRQMDYVLKGEVKMTAADQGKQKVLVIWTVLTPAGGEVGKATQENITPTGSLDGSWGETASMVATAAVNGIADILGRAEKAPREDNGSSPRGLIAPQAPKQVPGRAPPPPM
ncbi:MAG: hypothetical protein A3G18_12655 [Rhodospirillales bacterium RIFCSPLOWO2_12_FULL_58_28]|nr:MAG: hypothetical protein A3H92_10060 [Rhodospirillales bacterium RIFCSPLOWO2_02_FULL_58_16]OHC77118.1 MAG: hypothetical protein A3G18_12655 [Rhodospirillales bacterium RIFCSPLOWO2_12_FULL_58_28]